jgi:hypothetical protein
VSPLDLARNTSSHSVTNPDFFSRDFDDSQNLQEVVKHLKDSLLTRNNEVSSPNMASGGMRLDHSDISGEDLGVTLYGGQMENVLSDINNEISIQGNLSEAIAEINRDDQNDELVEDIVQGMLCEVLQSMVPVRILPVEEPSQSPPRRGAIESMALIKEASI